jgi:hypothetical protein
MPLRTNGWTPTAITMFSGNRPTGASVVIVDTDCGMGYLKGLGNEAGPHALACEFVGSLAADWLGLPTLDFDIIEVSEFDELPLAKGGYVERGPAFISKRVDGFPWGGDPESLNKLDNIADITRLVICDTWILNCDRRSITGERVRENRDNVFLTKAEKSGKLRLIAMDHTHAFTCGRELTSKINQIGTVQNSQRFGLFPEFETHWNMVVASDSLKRLAEFDQPTASNFIKQIPVQWGVEANVRSAWADCMVRRAHWLAGQEASMWLPNQSFSES